MSLLTRCPACITLYRVVPDQLRISDGWVKCGQCGEIFDASQHLVEEVVEPAPPNDVSFATAPALDVPTTPAFEDPQWVKPLPNTSATVADVELALDEGLLPEEKPEPVPPVQMPEIVPGALAGEEPHTDVEAASAQMQTRWDDEPQVQSPEVAHPAAAAPDDAPVTLLKRTDRPSVWQKPLVRMTLMLLGLLLGLSLAGQWVYLERDRLAALHPELKPALLAFCGVANCQVQALKQIESLSVDSVGFHLLSTDTYRLAFTIKNASALPLAVPNVELALTDTGDQAVFRRVFAARDLPAAPVQIAAGGEWPVTVTLRVKPMAPAQRVLGYRLLVFYP